MKKVTIRMTENLKQNLKIEALKKGTSTNELITDILLDRVNDISREKMEIQKKVDQLLVTQIDLLEALTD